MALSDNSLVDLATRLGSDRIQRDAPEGSLWGSSAAPVVFAESEEEVQAVMRWSAETGSDRSPGKRRIRRIREPGGRRIRHPLP